MVKKNLRRVRTKNRKTKTDSYILKEEYKSFNRAHVEIDPIKNEVKNENLKTEEKVNNEQDSNREEYAQKTIKRVYFTKQ